ncbi:DUF3413 domain-containing protein [Kushneria aurantia]|uniref:DUF3413 domain-containing protein n=1 Tax=Kushneria aurantia TaxID=504092 RepID=A0ABV6G1I6_9GAMM|nr:DUF3413 domain-containing protein [Kushneria aurantia]
MPRISEDSLRFRLRASAFYTLFTLLLVWLVSLSYLPTVTPRETPLGIAWLVSVWLGGFGTLAVAAWIVLALLALFLKRRWMVWPAAVLATLGLGAIILDTRLMTTSDLHLLELGSRTPVVPGTGWWLLTGSFVVLAALFSLWLAWRVFARARRIAFPVGSALLLMPLLLIASVAIDLTTDADQTAALGGADSAATGEEALGSPATPVPEALEAASQRNASDAPVIDDSVDPVTTRDGDAASPGVTPDGAEPDDGATSDSTPDDSSADTRATASP